MSKFRGAILLIGILIIMVVASIATFLVLYFTGAIAAQQIELVYTVSDAYKTYDGTPLTAEEYVLTSGELTDGHTEVVKFTGSQTNAGESLSGMSVKILDADGFDVTNLYSVKVEEGLLTVEKNEITVKLNDSQVIYGGQTVEFNDYSVIYGTLVSGHKISGSVSSALLNVGDRLPADIEPVIYDAVGTDVTQNYDVTFEMGNIAVIARPLSVKPVDMQKVYDGTALICSEYEILSGSLVKDHYAEVTLKGILRSSASGNLVLTDASITNAGVMLTTVYDFKIYEVSGSNKTDVTKNYDIDYSDLGSLVVNRRDLYVTAKSATWTYDGQPHSIEDGQPLSVTGLANNERLLSVEYGEDTITEAGTIASQITSVNLDGGSSDNYNIICLDGKLEVTKANVTVFCGSYSKEYDGKPVNMVIPECSPSLPTGLKLTYTSTVELTPEVQNKTYTCTVAVVNDENRNVSSNFNLTVVSGQIVITQREIKISTPSQTKEYDGKALSGNDLKQQVREENLLENHIITYGGSWANITDVGSVLNIFTKANIYDGADDVTDNYRISASYGTLTVTPKQLNVQLNDLNSVYSGAAFAPSKLQALPQQDSYGAEIPYDKLELVYGEMVDAGEYSYSAKFSEPQINYSLNVISGKITISKFDITIALADTNKTYDGIPLTLNDVVEGTFYTDGELSISINPCVTQSDLVGKVDAGEYKYSAQIAILSEDKSDLTYNFNVIVQEGTYTIKKLPVKVEYYGTTEKIYDAAPFEFDLNSFTISEPKYTLSGVAYEKLIRVCNDETVTFTQPVIMNSDGKVVTDNLDISFTDAYVTINQRPLVLTVQDYICNVDSEQDSTIRLSEEVLMSLVGVSGTTPLLNGDYIDVTGDLVTYNPSRQLISIDADELIIKNVNGEIVTDCYLWQNEDVTGRVVIIPA